MTTDTGIAEAVVPIAPLGALKMRIYADGIVDIVDPASMKQVGLTFEEMDNLVLLWFAYNTTVRKGVLR